MVSSVKVSNSFWIHTQMLTIYNNKKFIIIYSEPKNQKPKNENDTLTLDTLTPTIPLPNHSFSLIVCLSITFQKKSKII